MHRIDGEPAKELFIKIKEQYQKENLIVDHDKDENVDRIQFVTYKGVGYEDCRVLTTFYRDIEENLMYKVEQFIHKQKGLDLCEIEIYDNGFFTPTT